MTLAQLASTENLGRGTARALLVVPLGIAGWLVVWNLGFIASIVAAAVSVLAVLLFKSGAGRMSGRGALIVSLISAFTVVAALVAGFCWDVAAGLMEFAGLDALGAVTDPAFLPLVVATMTGPGLMDVLLSLGFGVLGGIFVLWEAFREGRRHDAAAFPGFGQPSEAFSPITSDPGARPHSFIGSDPEPATSVPMPVPALAGGSWTAQGDAGSVDWAAAPQLFAPSAPAAEEPWAPAQPEPAAAQPWSAPQEWITPAEADDRDWVMPSSAPAEAQAAPVEEPRPALMPFANAVVVTEPAPAPAPATATATDVPVPADEEWETTGSVPRPPVTRVVTRELEVMPDYAALAR